MQAVPVRSRRLGMKRLLTTAAVASLMLGIAASAGAQSWTQSGSPPMSFGYCNRSTGDIADCLNRAIADRNDAATATAYGSSGVTRYEPTPVAPATTTTTTTTYSRTIYPPPYYPPPYPGASR
jgi:hypothetical protein